MSHRLDETASGVYVIAVTPFTDAGLIDEASIDSVVEFYLEKGVTGMTILGMMGESHKLSMEESRAVMNRYLSRIDGRIPVVVGVSNPGTDPLVSFSKEAMDAGAAGAHGRPGQYAPDRRADLRLFLRPCSTGSATPPWCCRTIPSSPTSTSRSIR